MISDFEHVLKNNFWLGNLLLLSPSSQFRVYVELSTAQAFKRWKSPYQIMLDHIFDISIFLNNLKKSFFEDVYFMNSCKFVFGNFMTKTVHFCTLPNRANFNRAGTHVKAKTGMKLERGYKLNIILSVIQKRSVDQSKWNNLWPSTRNSLPC